MGLAETLRQRAQGQGRTAQVDCGALGTLTVEALPVRELELLLRGADGERAVFYAACRELQRAGEALRQSGEVFTPDGILQFVSDEEASAAVRTILELSGQAAQNHVDRSPGRASDVCENRLAIVQEKVGADEVKTAENMGANRLAPVQSAGGNPPLPDENRLVSVQSDEVSASGFGQVSRETEADWEPVGRNPEPDKKAQAMGILSPERTQNVENLGYSLEGASRPLHETESDFGGSLHEITSELRENYRSRLHEMTSEFPNGLHETESDFGKPLHETESDFGEIRRSRLHETMSEFGGSLHETASDFPKSVHETTSELAEAVARQLLEGLQRAKWVRGG